MKESGGGDRPSLNQAGNTKNEPLEKTSVAPICGATHVMRSTPSGLTPFSTSEHPTFNKLTIRASTHHEPED